MKHYYPAASRLLTGLWRLLLLAGIASPVAVHAQSYSLPLSGSNTITTCAGTLYDDGGANGSYSTYASGATTILPATAGNKVRLQFTTFAVETYYDRVSIYDGTSTSAPLIGTYDSSTPPTTVYGTTASGALTVQLTSDGVGQFNGFAATIGCVTTVPPQAQADLTVQSAYLSPLSVVAGGSTSASCYIYNLSGATASSSSVGFYLSTDAVLDATDQLLGSAIGYALPVSQSSSRYANLTVPVGTAAGNYYVLFVADYQNQVSESNENNNVATVNLTVTPPSIDLTIQQATVTPQNIAPGTPLSMSCYIDNQGNAMANSSSVGFYFSTDATLDAADQLLTSQYGAALYPNYTQSRYGTAAVPTGTAPGTYYILFVADYQNQVGETNETNNVSAVSFTVSPPGVDLVIQQEYLYPSSTVAGNSVQATCTIFNQGNMLANSSTVGFYLSTNQTFDAADVLLNTSTGSSLSANLGSYRSVYPVIPVGTAAGNYYVLFVADPANAVTETSETNNVRSVALTVLAATIDLTIQTPYLTPTVTAPGGTTAASCYLYNQGNALANTATVGYYLSTNQTLDASDVLLGNTTGSLYGGGYASRYTTLTIPTGTAVGNYYILFVADHLNQVTETVETNNIATASLQVVAPGIDLMPSQAYVTPYSSAPGNTVAASSYMQNLGNSTAPSSTLGYYLSTNQTLDASDVLLLTSPGGTLAANQYISRYDNVPIPVGTAPGSYYMLFVADPANAVTETNENNNVVSTALVLVAPGVDLTITQPYLTPTSVAPGSTLSTYCYIQNLGNSTAASSTIGYYLSTNQTLDASDVLLRTTVGSSLGAGQYTYRSDSPLVPTSTAPGNYYVLFVADPSSVVTETNESNNVASAPLLVIAPGIDLQIQQPYLSTTTVTPGFTLSGNCYIQNAGNTTAASSNVGFYLSTNQTLDASDVLLSTASGFSLPASQTSYRLGNLLIPTGTTAGNYYVLFVADPTNAVAETNENNNVSALPLTVLGPFTGTIVPYTGSSTITTCSATIYDNGGYNAYSTYSSGSLTILPATTGAMVQLTFNSFSTTSGYDYVRIYDGTSTNAPLLGSYTGNQIPLPLTATNTAGALTVQFTSTYYTAAGFDATVNCVAAPLSDLLLTQIGASPSSVPAGGSLSLSATIANQGGGPAASSAVGYYLSTNQTLDASDRLLGTSSGTALGVNLDANRQLVAPVPANVTPGPYYVLFVADPANVVSETNENNNIASLAVTVTQGLASRDQTAGYTVAVVPNPVAGGNALRVQLSGAGTTNAAVVELYNALGQRVLTQNMQLSAGRANQAELSTQGLATGVYTLRLTGKDMSVTRRVVID
ncbi:CARDB domain-containing protein [Hymenobacter negativus]|uniref:T9SS type A sorting domain-containing protein n=1 Tax=Hymenobacter negativus TaxID=2795026 RepID=A0ABS3QMB1_9BACT|nr:CARDB domain-containing protein [Hymenobacter negativus]MBO2012402.1 T9SS type A sorting domain-containing protein [Hymenobacter negativus]